MPSEAHQRIDEGIRRGPRKQVDRRPKQALENGRFIAKMPDDQRQAIITQSYDRLRAGEPTDQIAASYGLSGRTLRHWLLDDPQADQARRTLINGELARTLDEMRCANDPLPLARAREEFRAWSWIAERREARLYGQKQEVTHAGLVPVLNISVVQAAPVAGLVIEHDPQEV